MCLHLHTACWRSGSQHTAAAAAAEWAAYQEWRPAETCPKKRGNFCQIRQIGSRDDVSPEKSRVPDGVIKNSRSRSWNVRASRLQCMSLAEIVLWLRRRLLNSFSFEEIFGETMALIAARADRKSTDVVCIGIEREMSCYLIECKINIKMIFV